MPELHQLETVKTQTAPLILETNGPTEREAISRCTIASPAYSLRVVPSCRSWPQLFAMGWKWKSDAVVAWKEQTMAVACDRSQCDAWS